MFRRICFASALSTAVVLTVSSFIGSSQGAAQPAADPETRSIHEPQVYVVPPGPQVEHELLGLLIRAVPGDTIQLTEGTYRLSLELMVTQDHITIRGKGPDKTILSFKNQDKGSKGLEATGDCFVIEDLAVEDTIGNAIKVLGADGVTFRRVRTEWTGGPKPANGAYGIYPVQCENVLIDECVAIGASDAGIYVGQSQNVIVRNSRAERNVAGIEIENTINADVYGNVATDNTGGILVFDLPGLDVTNGRRIRVFDNRVFANNHKNFAPPGNIVGSVPPGTGLMLMAANQVEVFHNEIRNHQTANVSVVSYLITGNKINDPNYDPYCEGISIHDNTIGEGGGKPGGPVGLKLLPILGVPFPDILYDGMVDPEKLVDGQLPREHGIYLENNGEVTFANINLPLITPENILAGKTKIDRDPKRLSGRLDRLAAVELQIFPEPGRSEDPAVAVYRDAPQQLSEYGLFRGNGSTQQPVDGVVPYDLNTELFSDYTTKHRFIRVPEGSTVPYQEADVLEFPVGTVIAKTFASPRDMTDPSQGERLLETRIIEHKPSGWYGFAYVWNDEQTEAVLQLGGTTVDVQWKHTDGRDRENNYIVPHANQCKSCHVIGNEFTPLGPKVRNLNKDFEYPHGPENQLAYMSRIRLLHHAPAPRQAPRAPRFDDPASGTLDERARAWLDVNCAHCHSPTGSARTSGLDLRFEQDDLAKVGLWKTPVAAGRGSGGRKYDIVPGEPDQSILLFRLESNELGIMMPELPRRLVHEEGVALIREWVSQLQEPETGR